MVKTTRSVLLRSAAAVAAAAGIAGYSEPASACPTEAYLGSICTVTFDYCPEGYLKAQGQELTVAQNQALFAVLGSRYGGDGRTKFNLPDLRGRTIVAENTATGLGLSIYQLAQKRGVESVTLNSTQAPLQIHTHTASGAPNSTASGPVTLNVSSASPSVSVTDSNVNLPVTASNVSLVASVPAPKAVSSTAGTGLNIPPSGSTSTTLTRASSPSAGIYAPSGTAADLMLGPNATLTGTATGNITGTATGTVTSTGTVTVSGQTATGTISLPVSGGTGGITINPTGQPATAPTPVVDPSMALTVCIAQYGIFPTRP